LQQQGAEGSFAEVAGEGELKMDEPANNPKQGTNPSSSKPEWAGLTEIDQAISENRLAEYRFRKAWADPWSRGLGLLVTMAFLAFIVFVIVSELSR
jgi:hypothetical protein